MRLATGKPQSMLGKEQAAGLTYDNKIIIYNNIKLHLFWLTLEQKSREGDYPLRLGEVGLYRISGLCISEIRPIVRFQLPFAGRITGYPAR